MAVFAKTNAQSSSPNATMQKKRVGPFFGIQAKLAIGKSNDKYEKEADSVADKIVAKSQNKDNFFGGESFFPAKPKPIVQKSPFEEVQKKEEQEEIQEKSLAESITPVVQLASDDEEETVQEKCAACEAEEQKVQKVPFEDVQEKSKQLPIQKKCVECEKREAAKNKENEAIQRKGAVEFPALPEGVKEEKELQNAEEAAMIPGTEEAPAEEVPAEGAAGEAPAATDLPAPEPPKKKEKEELPPIQTKSTESIQAKSGSTSSESGIESSLKSSKGGGSAMSKNTQEEMSSGFGADFSKVRIHTGSRAVQMNKDLGSHAFTNGSDIYFNSGKYDPGSKAGKHLLAHELTHTVQQGAAGNSIQKFDPPGKKASPEGNPEKPNDGAAVEGKSNNKINNDDRVKDQDDLDEDEIKEKKDPPRGEVHSEKSSVASEGITTPPVDRGGEALSKIEGQKAEMNEQLSADAPAAEAEGEGGEQAENSNLGEADAAEQRSQAALQAANAVPIPAEPQPFKHPNVVAPIDSAGKDLPRQGKIDTQVRGLGYIGEMLREKGYEMKKHAAEKKIQSHGLDGSLETSRSDLALAKEGTQMTEDQNTERKDISEKSKKALDESKDRQQFVATEAPALAAEAKKGESDSGALASDANSKASQSKSEIPDDPDAKADAEKQSAEMDQTSQGAQSMDDAITQTGERATQYIADAEQASGDNQQSEAQITETDSVITQLDGRVAEMKGLNEQSQASIDNSAAGPDLIRQHSEKTAASGDQLIAATIVMETELNALQDEYLAGMAAIESKEAAEERIKKEEEEKQQQEASPEELQLYSLAALPEEEQQAQIETLPEAEKKGLMAALDKMIAETPDDGTAETEGQRLEVKLSSGEGGPPADPRQEQIGAVDQQRTTRLGGVLDIADVNMNFLSAEQQRMLAEKLVAESITDDIKNISVQQMAKGMLEGMVNPMAALQGVVGGFEKTFSGVANIFNADAWAKDPLGNLLQIAADISTGLAMVFSSILGIAGMITALMVALTILSWGTLTPITGPVIGWMGTVMTYAGWGAIIAGLLSVYFNSLAYIKNLNDAGTATTARELFGNTEQMKQNATDGFTGAMAVVEGVGAVKMGPVMKSGQFMKNVPKSPGAFARQTLDGAKDGLGAVAKLPGRAAAGAKKLFAGGKGGLVKFKQKIQGLLRRTDAPDAPGTPGTKKKRQEVLDTTKDKKLDDMTPEQRRVDLEETGNNSPRAIDPDSPHFATHDVEINSNGHTYRRRKDGQGWCRFSAKECGIQDGELPDDVQQWLDDNDALLRDKGHLDDTPEAKDKARQDAEKDIADSEGPKNKTDETPNAEPTVQHPPDNPNHTKRQKDFEAEIRKKVENGDLTPDEAQGLRDFNEANKSGARDVDSVLDDVRNPDLELNPATGRYKNKNGSGGLEIDDATRKKTEANRKWEGEDKTPPEGSPKRQELADQKAATQQKVKDAEAEIDALNDPNNTTPEAVEHRQAKADSFEKRNPKAESESKFNKEYDDINGGDPSDPNYIKEREAAFDEHRAREQQAHSDRYDRGRKNNKAGDAFEKSRTDQRNADLEKEKGRPLKPEEKVRQRTPAEKEVFDLDGEKIKVSPDLEDPGPPISYIESKSGKISLTPEVEDQIIRYAKLTQKTGRKVTYELLDGASPAVFDAMKRYGVHYIDFSKL